MLPAAVYNTALGVARLSVVGAHLAPGPADDDVPTPGVAGPAIARASRPHAHTESDCCLPSFPPRAQGPLRGTRHRRACGARAAACPAVDDAGPSGCGLSRRRPSTTAFERSRSRRLAGAFSTARAGRSSPTGRRRRSGAPASASEDDRQAVKNSRSFSRLATVLGMPVADIKEQVSSVKESALTPRTVAIDVPMRPSPTSRSTRVEFPGVEVRSQAGPPVPAGQACRARARLHGRRSDDQS